jgi:hypothetical protein
MTPIWAGLIAGFVATAILSMMQIMTPSIQPRQDRFKEKAQQWR